MGVVADRIHKRLHEAFDPTRLEVTDDSARHAGHAGARPQGETHFTVAVVSATFEGESKVVRQRRVYAALAQELRPDGVHALALSTLTPGEAASA